MAGVRTTHKDYDRFAPKWKRVRDVVAGQDAIHAAKTAYLPKLKDESDGTFTGKADDNDYAARLKRSDFFNGTWRTIDALGGMAFRKPPTIDVPAAIEPYFTDITLAGMSMEDFAKEVLEEALSFTRYGILIDHPPRKVDDDGNVVPISQAVAERMGLRPTLQLYMTESIRNWKYKRVNNAWVLSMVTLGECEAVPVDEFTDKEEDRYRVLDLDESGLYRQRVFTIDERGNDVLLFEFYPLMNGKPLQFIPFKMPPLDEPPLIDLVDKNIAHYQVNSDYRHGLHFTGLPTLFLSGMRAPEDGSKYYIGSGAAILADDPNARGMFIEFTGQGLGAIKDALDRIERQMALLGARMIADETKQAETLGATQIKRAGENSVLAKIVQSVSESLEWALGVFAQWAGQSGKIVYQINRDFMPAMMDAQTLTALIAAVAAGELSSEEFFVLLQRGDLVDGAKTFAEHQAQVEIQNPAPVKPTAKPGEAAAA